MADQVPESITHLLAAASGGDEAAQRKLWDVLYGELRRLAHRQVTAEPPGRAHQTTSLVHEAYLRLLANEDVEWANRRHFFAAAAQIMREIRVDDARRRRRLKRGGGKVPSPLKEEPAVFEREPSEVLAIHEALDRLAGEHERRAEVVKMRYFAGISIDECASALGVSPRTVDSDWRLAKAWLHRELSKGDTAVGGDKHP